MSRQFTEADRQKAWETRQRNKEQAKQTQLPVVVNPTNDVMNELEKQMAQQLRIMNMHRMMEDLRTPKPQVQQQLSGMSDLVKIFKDLNSIKSEIRGEVETEETIEPMSMEERLLMQLISNTKQKQEIIPAPAPANNPMIPSNLTEAQIKTMIKQGLISKEQAKQFVKESGYSLTDEEFEQRWKALSE